MSRALPHRAATQRTGQPLRNRQAPGQAPARAVLGRPPARARLAPTSAPERAPHAPRARLRMCAPRPLVAPHALTLAPHHLLGPATPLRQDLARGKESPAA